MEFGGALLAFGFLVITRSKTSIGLLVLTLGVGYVFQLAARLGPRFGLLAFGGLAIALAGLLGVVLFNDFVWSDILASLVSDPTFTGRDQLWAFCLRESLKRMWLGHGYGAFWDVGAFNDPLAKLETGTWIGDVEVGIINEAHNGYLELWLFIGLPAMLLATWQVFSSISAMTGAAMRTSSRGAATALAMMAMILLSHLLHNLTEATLFMRNNPFSNTAELFMLVGFHAFASGRGRMGRRPRARQGGRGRRLARARAQELSTQRRRHRLFHAKMQRDAGRDRRHSGERQSGARQSKAGRDAADRTRKRADHRQMHEIERIARLARQNQPAIGLQTDSSASRPCTSRAKPQPIASVQAVAENEV